MVLKLYRNIVPLAFREKMYDLLVGDVVFFFRHFSVIARAKLNHWLGFAFPQTEENRAMAFIGKYGITSYPHPHMLEYKNLKVEVLIDSQLGLPFVFHKSRKLYFPKSYTAEKVAKDYRALVTEQDERSAHRYVRSHAELKGKTLLDVGAAEGIFSLDTIELTERTVLFECLEHWQPALEATFAPWREKVTIVKKFVGDKSEGAYIRLDDYLGNHRNHLFIKMDIEGAEAMALMGTSQVLQQGQDVQLSVCTYHRPGDPEFMKNLFNENGFATEFSEGLMYWNKRLSKGIIRAKKS